MFTGTAGYVYRISCRVVSVVRSLPDLTLATVTPPPLVTSGPEKVPWESGPPLSTRVFHLADCQQSGTFSVGQNAD